jgi:hypothetical protein
MIGARRRLSVTRHLQLTFFLPVQECLQQLCSSVLSTAFCPTDECVHDLQHAGLAADFVVHWVVQDVLLQTLGQVVDQFSSQL